MVNKTTAKNIAKEEVAQLFERHSIDITSITLKAMQYRSNPLS